MDERTKMTIRLRPDTLRRVEQWYGVENRSKNEFIEDAINDYADALAARDNALLPRAISSAIDGRLGQFENRLAGLSYKTAVELDMMGGILADALNVSEDDMRRRRAESVQNVKRTNGRISLEQRMRESVDDRGLADEDADEWPG